MFVQAAYLVIFLLATYLIGLGLSTLMREWPSQPDRRTVSFVLLSVPLFSCIPFLAKTLDFNQEYQIGFLQSVERILFTQPEGRVFVMLILVSVFMYLLFKRSSIDQLKIKLWVLTIGGSFILMITNLSNPSMFYVGWLGYTFSVVQILCISLITGVLFFLGKTIVDSNLSGTRMNFLMIIGIVLMVLLVASEVGITILLAPNYVTGWMVDYGQALYIRHLLYVPFLLLFVRLIWLAYRKKLDIKDSHIKRSIQVQTTLGIVLVVITAVMMTFRPPQDVLRTLETESVNLLVNWLVDYSLATYQVISFDTGPIIFIVIYLGVMFLLASIGLAFFSKKSFMITLCSSLFVIIMYGGTMAAVGPGDILVDDTIFKSEEEAIAASYEEDITIQIAYEEQNGQDLYLVYGVDERDLAIEKLEVMNGGYKRTPLSGIIIEDGLRRLQEQAVTTRKLETGNWLEAGFDYSYVSFGYVGKTEGSTDVELTFDGETTQVPINENNVFFNLIPSNENWTERHFVDLLDETGEKLASYQYESMTGGFHH